MTQDTPTPKSNRWTTRDVLTFVVFNLIIMAVTIVAKMIEDMVLTPQNTFFVGSWLFPLLATPFYVVMADRIGKRGVLAGSTLVFGLLYTFMGGLYCAPVAVVGALIGELVMWGEGFLPRHKARRRWLHRVLDDVRVLRDYAVSAVQGRLYGAVGNLLRRG